MKRRLIIMIGMMLLCTGICYADDEIYEADSIEEYIEETQNNAKPIDIIVDKDTGEVEGTNDNFNGDIEKEIIESDKYNLQEETNDTFVVSSVFEGKQVIVGDKLTETFGAKDGVYYDGETTLTFATVEETEEAYNTLLGIYGEGNVALPGRVVRNTVERKDGSYYPSIEEEQMRFYDQWKSIKASKKARKMTIGIADDGIRGSHEVFAGKKISPKSMAGSTNVTSPQKCHGTMVAGIISMAMPKGTEFVVADIESPISNGMSTIKYAAQNGAQVINASWGIEQNRSSFLYDAKQLKELADKGVIVCASSGNENRWLDEDNIYLSPAECESVVTVGSVERFDHTPSVFSNFGSCIDFAAPGENIYVPSNKGNQSYEYASGTSFSCAYITACASYVKMQYPNAKVGEVKNRLKQISSDPYGDGWNEFYGHGIPQFPKNRLINTSNVKAFVPMNSAYTGYGVKNITARIHEYSKSGKYDHTDVTNIRVAIVGKKPKNIGKHTVTVKGLGEYGGMRKATLTIVPSKPRNASLLAKGKTVIAKWTESKGADRYQIEITRAKTIKNKGGRTKVLKRTSRYTVKKRYVRIRKEKNTRYTIKVRGYKVVSRKAYYSPWTQAVSRKVVY